MRVEVYRGHHTFVLRAAASTHRNGARTIDLVDLDRGRAPDGTLRKHAERVMARRVLRRHGETAIEIHGERVMAALDEHGRIRTYPRQPRTNRARLYRALALRLLDLEEVADVG